MQGLPPQSVDHLASSELQGGHCFPASAGTAPAWQEPVQGSLHGAWPLPAHRTGGARTTGRPGAPSEGMCRSSGVFWFLPGGTITPRLGGEGQDNALRVHPGMSHFHGSRDNVIMPARAHPTNSLDVPLIQRSTRGHAESLVLRSPIRHTQGP